MGAPLPAGKVGAHPADTPLHLGCFLDTTSLVPECLMVLSLSVVLSLSSLHCYKMEVTALALHKAKALNAFHQVLSLLNTEVGQIWKEVLQNGTALTS